MGGNSSVNMAIKAKNDEFYTMYCDVEKELQHYKRHFKDKIVYCNCDDTSSAFWQYFCNNFETLGLKKLISTHYSLEFNAYKTEYCGGEERREKLMWNGDFRSPECQELLEECDIVCTNPPFSLFSEYVDQLMDYNKKFIITGDMNAVTYKEIFPLLKESAIWLGYNKPKRFIQPNGNIRSFGNILWFTNLDIEKRHEELTLTQKYNPNDYPKYDNYDAININKLSEIPINYDGVMGVPVTFIEKYNPTQFEMIGHDSDINGNGGKCVPGGKFMVNGRGKYKRILIRRR